MPHKRDLTHNQTVVPALPLLARYLGDWRTLLPGSGAGIMQLMYPPLGAAVFVQSDFFDDPFGRVYRSIPQIWATVLAPDGVERAKEIRDLHRYIQGIDQQGQRYHALEPETYWWAHATFTWEVYRAIELFFVGGLASVDQNDLYDETVEWYRRYGVSMKPVPANLTAFWQKFDYICQHTLQLTPAADRVLSMGKAGAWRPPLIKQNFRNPALRYGGRVVLFGVLPTIVRQRFNIPWRAAEARQFAAICLAIRHGTRFMPQVANRLSLELALKFIGNRTRAERYQPAA